MRSRRCLSPVSYTHLVYPGGLQVGGGITAENAAEYLAAGASHVIVTSYVFREGRIDYDRLDKLVQSIGKEHLVLDVYKRQFQGRRALCDLGTDPEP